MTIDKISILLYSKWSAGVPPMNSVNEIELYHNLGRDI